MPINVELRNENCKAIHALEGVYLTSAHVPDYDDSRYPCLRLIDPYGDTVFSRYQMVAVVLELETLVNERRSPEIEAVLALARRCADEAHYLPRLHGRLALPSLPRFGETPRLL